jgi:IS5 family transposase
MVNGKKLLTDSTHIKADVANHKRETITVTQELSEYMQKLDEAALADGLIKEVSKPKETPRNVTKSTTDPDSGILKRPGKPGGFHYLNHQTVDGDSGIITDVHVTAANTTDHQHHAERIKHQLEKFGFSTEAVGGDSGYDEPEMHAEMLKLGIKAYITRKARGTKKEDTYSRSDFTYIKEQDAYICPYGRTLKFSTFKKGQGTKRYSSKVADCRNCPLKDKCISGSGKVKHIEHSYHYLEYEEQHLNDTTSMFLEVQRLRNIWCEGTFSHQKARHCLSKAKMRGIVQTKGQCLLSACAVNIKRLIKWAKKLPLNSVSFAFWAFLAYLRYHRGFGGRFVIAPTL